MLLGWKIYDVLRIEKPSGRNHVHLTESNLALFAGLLIGAEVFRKRLLELQRDALTHHADTIDCVDEGLGIRL